jgi:hypothetical protein
MSDHGQADWSQISYARRKAGQRSPVGLNSWAT